MQKVEVIFRINPKQHSFLSSEILKPGDYVVVESPLGQSFGKVEEVSSEIPEDETFKKVLRKATDEDKLQNEKNAEKEKTALAETRRLVQKLKLDMNVVNAEYAFDGSKVLINFISENRVDFRELVRELASALHTRIELKQIGVRDQARMVGGIGVCGRVCCCSAYLKDFEKVSIKMAKTQDLALNPTKISGACGRLMCCLEYEDGLYNELQSQTPRVNSTVKTPDGVGTVVYRNLLKQIVSVKFETTDGSSHIKDFDVKNVSVERKQDDKSVKNFKKPQSDEN
jgi:cell fate regulator YaaT (PSP1 superfamily)